MLDLGSSEQHIAKQALRSGEAIPDRILNAPVLEQGLAFYLNAFFDLDAERSQGMSLGHIPWIATLTYGTYYGLDTEELDDLFFLIRELDNAHLKRLDAKSK